MLENTYTTELNDDFDFFEFDSVGPNGIIRKLVQYIKVPGTVYYNLAFGDKISQTNELDDLVVTNNSDTQKVMATVA